MKINNIILLLFFALFLMSNYSYADESKNNGTVKDTSSSSIINEAKDLKTKAQNTSSSTKKTIVHDVKEIKEQAPKDFKKAKDDIVNTSKEITNNVNQEVKEIHDGLKKAVK